MMALPVIRVHSANSMCMVWLLQASHGHHIDGVSKRAHHCLCLSFFDYLPAGVVFFFRFVTMPKLNIPSAVLPALCFAFQLYPKELPGRIQKVVDYLAELLTEHLDVLATPLCEVGITICW